MWLAVPGFLSSYAALNGSEGISPGCPESTGVFSCCLIRPAAWRIRNAILGAKRKLQLPESAWFTHYSHTTQSIVCVVYPLFTDNTVHRKTLPSQLTAKPGFHHPNNDCSSPFSLLASFFLGGLKRSRPFFLHLF